MLISKKDLKLTLLTNEDTCTNFSKFQDIFRRVLNRHAPTKLNEVPYMTKNLRKAIMTRSRLQNIYYKTNLVEKNILRNIKTIVTDCIRKKGKNIIVI